MELEEIEKLWAEARAKGVCQAIDDDATTYCGAPAVPVRSIFSGKTWWLCRRHAEKLVSSDIEFLNKLFGGKEE